MVFFAKVSFSITSVFMKSVFSPAAEGGQQVYRDLIIWISGKISFCSSKLLGNSNVLELKGTEFKLFNDAEQSLEWGLTPFSCNRWVRELELGDSQVVRTSINNTQWWRSVPVICEAVGPTKTVLALAMLCERFLLEELKGQTVSLKTTRPDKKTRLVDEYKQQ